MTLIAALEGQDGLVLASDSRGTVGDPRGLTAIRDVERKIFKLSDFCGIAVSGSSELASNVIDNLTRSLGDVQYIDPLVEKVYTTLKSEFTKWFGGRTWVSPQPVVDQRPVMIFLLAGFTEDRKPRIFLLNSGMDFAPQLCTAGHMLAGIPQYAVYLLHRLYNRQMHVEHLSALAAYLISETATQDPKVGGPIRISQITPSDGYKELEDSVIQEIIKRNEEQNRKLRQFFFEEVKKSER